ncbi:DUF2663 family protein [Sporolactobacillus shoreae]|uniref:DUF2663 family protein n=1 Tax=Sporolactobacillus shoreae TaxID=1465501 RepID=UPI001432F5F4|nr:DUF2663 family protein [Sporolactobacillus shoreae]
MSLDTLREKGALPALAYEILKELEKRKLKENHWKKRRSVTGFFLILTNSAFVLYLLVFEGRSMASLHGLNLMVREPEVLLLGVSGLLILFIYMRTQKEAKDAEDDFDELREEMIDRAWELWPKEPDGSGRYEIMQYLLKEMDINLFYK